MVHGSGGGGVKKATKREPGPGRPRTSPEKRFWSKVEITPKCWNWTDQPNRSGYGRLGTDGKHTLAHRFSWTLHGNELAPDEELDHICHNRLCVNPAHLRIASREDNNRNLRGAYRTNSSGVRGVTETRNGRYRAIVTKDGVQHYLGRFDHLEDAERAVIEKRLEIFPYNEVDYLRAIELGIIERPEQEQAA